MLRIASLFFSYFLLLLLLPQLTTQHTTTQHTTTQMHISDKSGFKMGDSSVGPQQLIQC
jgi:hypothetical protein